VLHPHETSCSTCVPLCVWVWVWVTRYIRFIALIIFTKYGWYVIQNLLRSEAAASRDVGHVEPHDRIPCMAGACMSFKRCGNVENRACVSMYGRENSTTTLTVPPADARAGGGRSEAAASRDVGHVEPHDRIPCMAGAEGFDGSTR